MFHAVPFLDNRERAQGFELQHIGVGEGLVGTMEIGIRLGRAGWPTWTRLRRYGPENRASSPMQMTQGEL
jgi:hypothetical protein